MTTPKNPSAQALGRLGGLVRSAAKLAACRENARKALAARLAKVKASNEEKGEA